MRLLLAEPPQFFLDGSGISRSVLPLGLGYVAAVASHEHDVRMLLPDTRSYTGGDPWGEIERAVRDKAPDVVGITSVTANYTSAVQLAETVKAVNADICVVLGGVHASTEPTEALLGAPDVDYVVQGEGEFTMLELLREIEQRRLGGVRPHTIPGLFWRDDLLGVQSSAPRAPTPDLDLLPAPMRDGLVWEDDIHPGFYRSIVTMRGCPYRCIYCAIPSSNDRRTRFRSPSNVVDEIAMLRQRFDIPDLFFHDSVFTMKRSRTIEICDTMIERDAMVPFNCQTRADRVDLELLERMKQAGCKQIFFGIESGDPDSLAQIRKRMDLDTIRDAVRMVKDLDIRCTGFFMIGFPWETEAQMRTTADFATSLGLDAISLFSATPLPGTELWDMVGGVDIPDSIDFRSPQVNTTALPDGKYAELFAGIKVEMDQYNQDMMYQRAAQLQEAAAVSWLG